MTWGMVGMLELWLAKLPVKLEEPLGLRWLRALVQHPVRAPLALTACLAALWPRRRRS